MFELYPDNLYVHELEDLELRQPGPLVCLLAELDPDLVGGQLIPVDVHDAVANQVFAKAIDLSPVRAVVSQDIVVSGQVEIATVDEEGELGGADLGWGTKVNCVPLIGVLRSGVRVPALGLLGVEPDTAVDSVVDALGVLTAGCGALREVGAVELGGLGDAAGDGAWGTAGDGGGDTLEGAGGGSFVTVDLDAEASTLIVAAAIAVVLHSEDVTVVCDILEAEVGDVGAGGDQWVHFEGVVRAGSDTNQARDDQVDVARVEVVVGAGEAYNWAWLVGLVVFLEIKLAVVVVELSVAAELVKVRVLCDDILSVGVKQVRQTEVHLGNLEWPDWTVPLTFSESGRGVIAVLSHIVLVCRANGAHTTGTSELVGVEEVLPSRVVLVGVVGHAECPRDEACKFSAADWLVVLDELVGGVVAVNEVLEGGVPDVCLEALLECRSSVAVVSRDVGTAGQVGDIGNGASICPEVAVDRGSECVATGEAVLPTGGVDR